jgi:uncharacterized protein (TIGR00661 family)
MKILYGVPGEGMGHATRSRVIIEHLLKEHDVKVVSSNRAFKFLHGLFGDRVIEINGFHLAYNNSKVSKLKTLTSTLKTAPKNLVFNYKKYSALKDSFTPDLVISDYESFTFLFAKTNDIPLLSIDNIQILSRCELDIKIPSSERSNYQIAKTITQAKVPGAFDYLITTFFYPEIKKTPTTLVPPIVRKTIEEAKPTKGEHILVYQTSTSQGNLISILQELKKETFYVYGFNKSENHGNVILKPFSEAGFIEDLASAKAVIANGGFSLISECVYLHKPVCSIPIQNQFEQFVNAAYIEKLGYGRHFHEFHPDSIKAFLYGLSDFEKNLEGYRQKGNEELFRKLDAAIKSVKI